MSCMKDCHELTAKVLEQAYTKFWYGGQSYTFEILATPHWFRMVDQAVHSFRSTRGQNRCTSKTCAQQCPSLNIEYSQREAHACCA